MKRSSVDHATFTIDRVFDASVDRVYAAFADPAAKRRWFSGPDEWDQAPREMDFRVGGRERVSGGPKGGTVHTFEARYHDIVPNERIVYAYEMYLDERRISVSLATLELEPVGTKTRVKLTEQGVFFEGADGVARRERGTEELFDKLTRALGN